MPNLFQKLLSGASNVGGRIEDGLMPTPADGLFKPEDIAAARKQGMLHLGLSLLGDTSGMGLGSALKNGVQEGQDAYGGKLNDISAQNAALKDKQMIAARQQVMQKYTPAEGATPQAMMQQFPAMYTDLMRLGDNKGAEQLRVVIERMAENQGKSDKFQTVQLGDRVLTFDPATGKYSDASGKPVTDTSRHQTPEEIADHALGHRIQEEQLAQTRMLREQSMGQQAGVAFARQNQDLTKTEQQYQNWDAAYKSAMTGNPAAYKSAIVNFASIADPKSQIRLGMLNYLEKVDPSVKGRWDLAVQKLANGSYPPQVLENMNKHVQDIHRTTIKLYNERRSGRVKVHPEWDTYLPATSEVFPSVNTIDATTPSMTGQGTRVDQFLNNFGPKK